MGLFGWHKCGEPGCDAVLFVPLFDAKEHGAPEDGASWRAYLAERPTWHLVDESKWHDPVAVASERCPVHKVMAHEAQGEDGGR